MATCKNCGKEYLTRECLNCRNKNENKIENQSEKEKLFKTIRYAIIFFIGLLVIGIIIDVIITSYFIKTASPTINNINKMTNEMVKANRKLMKQMEKGFQIPNQNR